MSIRAKLFAVSLGLVSVVGLISGVWLVGELRTWHEERIEKQLLHNTQIARDAVSLVSPESGSHDLQALAVQLGTSINARVSIIGTDGTVLGDSKIKKERLESLENHADRPEIRHALSHGKGTSRRYSNTLKTEMLYMAVPIDTVEKRRPVVRVAVSLSEVDESVESLRWLLVVAGILGLAIAIFMSGLTSHYASNTLQRLTRGARNLARRRQERIELNRTDDLGLLAGTLNRLATDLEDSVQTLATERNRLSTILEGMTAGVLALDGQQRVTIANSAALDLFQLHKDPTGCSIEEITDAAELLELAAASRDGAVKNEIRLNTGTEGQRVLCQGAPVEDDGSIVLVMEDVTNVRKLEAIRSDFVANVSHELRTPVSAIQANAETVQSCLQDGDIVNAQEFSNTVLRNARRLGAVIRDLMTISRIEDGQVDLRIEPVVVRALVADIIETAQNAANAKNVSLINTVPVATAVLASPDLLQQVLSNFVENALRYTASGGHVRISAVAKDQAIRIEVEDDGPGIAKEHQERIFERFYRVDPGRSRAEGGTGLGLSIVKHCASAMNGTVGVDSPDPTGSLFWVELQNAPPKQ